MKSNELEIVKWKSRPTLGPFRQWYNDVYTNKTFAGYAFDQVKVALYQQACHSGARFWHPEWLPPMEFMELVGTDEEIYGV